MENIFWIIQFIFFLQMSGVKSCTLMTNELVDCRHYKFYIHSTEGFV